MQYLLKKEIKQKNWWGSEYYELASRIVQGKTLLEKTLSDISFAINYLETRDETDKSKIGFIGHSYGGRMAYYYLLMIKDKSFGIKLLLQNLKDSLISILKLEFLWS